MWRYTDNVGSRIDRDRLGDHRICAARLTLGIRTPWGSAAFVPVEVEVAGRSVRQDPPRRTLSGPEISALVKSDSQDLT